MNFNKELKDYYDTLDRVAYSELVIIDEVIDACKEVLLITEFEEQGQEAFEELMDAYERKEELVKKLLH